MLSNRIEVYMISHAVRITLGNFVTVLINWRKMFENLYLNLAN